MIEQEQRIAIAEVCGWKFNHKDHTGCPPNKNHFYYRAYPEPHQETDCPNYPQDLNAMHEAENYAISNDLFNDDNWIQCLVECVLPCSWRVANEKTIAKALARAKPQQRAEAFLKTIGKWKEV